MTYNNLKTVWETLVTAFPNASKFSERYWATIANHYQGRNRAYHNLDHISAMLNQLSRFEKQLEDAECLKLSIFYHDIIYNPLRKDNEYQSARLAKDHLAKLGFELTKINRCFQQILITKTHLPIGSNDPDQKWLIDLDLSVLSASWEDYQIYCQQIRKEYWMFPRQWYNKGRIKVLNYFITRPFIYQTNHFREFHESNAKANLKKELETLR